MNSIIVSAFLLNINTRKDKSKNDYIKFGIKLLEINVPKIIFIDPELFDIFKNINPLNKFILFTKEQMYLYNYINQITNFTIITNNPDKDTNEYFMLNIHKSEFIKLAINSNLYNSDQYIWIDFGIYFLFEKSVLGSFNDIICNIVNKKYDNIRIASIDNHNSINLDLIYNKIYWVFAGGVFGGNKNALLQFADLVKESAINLIQKNNILIYEVNLWIFIYLENKELFNLYKCNHNPSILLNY